MTVRTGSARRVAPEPRTASVGAGKASRAGNLLFLALALVGCVHASAMLGVESYRHHVSQQQIARLSADIMALEREEAALEAIIAHAGDAEYREHLARCLGFVRPGEVRYLSATGLSEPQPAGLGWCQ